MELFEISALLVSLSAVFSYVNVRWVKLPTTIGVMIIALAFSLALIGMGLYFPSVRQRAESFVATIDFNETLMHGMLGFLLFAGALHINLDDLRQQRWLIASLASVGVLISTFVVAVLTWLITRLLGLEMGFIHCLLFGALISPTDPIAVLSILKQAGVSKELETKIAGESLFNDGMGVVVFLGLLEIATGEHGFDLGHLTALFFQEAVGGAVFGLAIGYVAYRMLKTIDNYSVEILLSLAVAAGGYALASAWHLSGPIAMVVAGLFLGNHGRNWAMSANTREHLDTFWELIDEILNAVLFVLIGLEVLVLTFTGQLVLAGVLAIPAVLLARTIAVGIPLSLMRRRKFLPPQTARILVWGGIRGGVSVALALSLPTVNQSNDAISPRTVILAMTYIVVIFSIVVQGLTIGPLVSRSTHQTEPESNSFVGDTDGSGRPLHELPEER